LLDLNATVQEIVQRSFHPLRGIRISCELKTGAEDFLAGIRWRLSEPREIIITFSAEDVKQMPDPALVGCIVHELCHAEYDIALSPSTFDSNDKRYASDPEFRSTHEREIDLEVIRKGYGRELLALQLYHNEHYEAYQTSDGLTSDETERIIGNPTET
jgi:hypothetical protein